VAVHKDLIGEDVNAFLFDRQARGLSGGSVRFYRQKLALVRQFCTAQGIASVAELDTAAIRQLLVELQRAHTPGGVHAVYRALRAFLLWWQDEAAPSGWSNPLRRVRAPRVGVEPLQPIEPPVFRKLLAQCRPRTFHGDRDRAVLVTLADTGCRASELLAINHGDLDLPKGQILIRQGKGRKPRMVFIEASCRKAIAAYLRHLATDDPSAPLWRTNAGERLTYEGLRDIVRRLARAAGIAAPTLHAFRRTFAITALRNGMDVFALQRLMGHADLTVLRRYLAQTDEDLKLAHRKHSPAESLGRASKGGRA
jgi:site-specific recombinase XerD